MRSSQKMVNPLGQLGDGLIGAINLTIDKIGKNGKNGIPVGPLADGVTGIVNRQRALK